MTKLIKADFHSSIITFNDDGWFNATEVANHFGKRVDHWLANKETQDYISALNTRNYGDLMQTKKGKNGGTWLHPKLAIMFARWVSIDFAIWCDEQIENIIHGNQNAIDWNMMRHSSKATNKVACEMLKMIRAEQGKDTEPYHYANEAKLVNWALTGEFKPVDRDALPIDDLNLLASLENRNSVLLGRGVDRETRKEMLSAMAEQHKHQKLAA
jgi:hypothetical protein